MSSDHTYSAGRSSARANADADLVRSDVGKSRADAARGVQRSSLGRGPVTRSDLLSLQRSLGNTGVGLLLDRSASELSAQTRPVPRTPGFQGAAVQRRLFIDNKPVDAAQLTRRSRYRSRLNSVISQEALKLGLTPKAQGLVRGPLVQILANMATDTDDGDGRQFATMESAVRAAMLKLPIALRVKIALANLRGGDLSQGIILKQLAEWFGGGLHAATKTPEFAEALLEEIRQKQSTTWVKATTIRQVQKTEWTNQELQYWTARHYTNKFMVVLGQAVDSEGTFAVAGVEPPPFTELLSSITLATMNRTGGTTTTAHKPGDKVMMTFSSGAATSGHTTGIDWTNIGNVGDTFYGLFYGDKPASGLTPGFIKDAVYYAMWPVSEFGSGWASADWLAKASESQTERGATPEGEARQGELADIIADIFPDATTRDLGATGGQEQVESREEREQTFQAMENFEVKRHGPITVKEWLPIEGNIERIKTWRVKPTTGEIVKNDTDIRRHDVVATAGYGLLKEARRLNVFEPGSDVDRDEYRFATKTFSEATLTAQLDVDQELFDRLKEAVDRKKAEEAAKATQVGPVGPPPSAPTPPPPQGFRGGAKPLGPGKKALVVVGGTTSKQ